MKKLNSDREICLVTGATGFIGSALVEYLLNKAERQAIKGVEEKKTRDTIVETPRITAMGTPNKRRTAKLMQMVSIT